jgi:hypothetical protein
LRAWRKGAKGRGRRKDVICDWWRRRCTRSFTAFSALTALTANVENKGTLETARKIAAHESPRTPTLYDRTDDWLTLDEIEKISV